MSELTVKIFRGHEQATITPVANRAEARQVFQAHVDDLECNSVYVYDGDRIIASWDSHAEYLMAIGDAELDDDGCWYEQPYGDRNLYDTERTIEDVRSEVRTKIRLARFGDEVQP